MESSATAGQIQPLLPAREEDGQSLLEMAIVLPLFLLILFGIFTFGTALNNYILLVNATDVGARQLAISRGQTTDPCAVAVSAITAAASALNSANLTYTFSLNGNTYSGVSCSSNSTTTGAAGNLQQNTTASVTVTYPCQLSSYNWRFGSPCLLTTSISEMVQ